ncbi:hypothetical protein RRG08_022017 [Elysia crispata]|uniref:Reverse transcriptase n=1 Tax=Elysia crispata TaxID=231223 RepID=A0AAE1D789_9GAST|nr:hypothetical protein RRG08_022017 [Elysia crispata]
MHPSRLLVILIIERIQVGHTAPTAWVYRRLGLGEVGGGGEGRGEGSDLKPAEGMDNGAQDGDAPSVGSNSYCLSTQKDKNNDDDSQGGNSSLHRRPVLMRSILFNQLHLAGFAKGKREPKKQVRVSRTSAKTGAVQSSCYDVEKSLKKNKEFSLLERAEMTNRRAYGSPLPNNKDLDCHFGKPEVLVKDKEGCNRPKTAEEADRFQERRSITDQITTHRIIVINFPDNKPAFDSIGRDTLWKILRNRGIPERLVDLIKICKETICRTVHGDQITGN